jgi:hypothetical protein
MELRALVCVNCGGPLAVIAALPAVVECAFCGAAISVSHERTLVTRGGSSDEARAARTCEARVAFHATLTELLKGGVKPYDALREASAAHFGAAGRTEAVARVTLAIARDFERESGTRAVTEPLVLGRIAEAYLRAVDELQSSDAVDMNLPFLTADSEGPKHLRRMIAAAILADLAQRDPEVALPDSPAERPPEKRPPAKKKGWWPF